MGSDSAIEWTHHTFNAWRGCTKVSDGCKHCYAETLSKRNPTVLGVWGPKGTRAPASESYWKEPIAWDQAAAAAGERHRVFCASLADVFEGPETCQDPQAYAVIEIARVRLFQLIHATPNLDWLLLTKRPHNIRLHLQSAVDTMRPYALFQNMHMEAPVAWLDRWLKGRPPKNVWVGTSVEDQKSADDRIPHLLSVPASVHFLSCEPLLGSVNLDPGICQYCYSNRPADIVLAEDNTPCCAECGSEVAYGNWLNPLNDGIAWVICGGESGHDARPLHPDWARTIRDQCVEADCPFFFKQWGGSNKKAAGRLLDDRTWDEFPSPEHIND